VDDRRDAAVDGDRKAEERDDAHRLDRLRVLESRRAQRVGKQERPSGLQDLGEDAAAEGAGLALQLALVDLVEDAEGQFPGLPHLGEHAAIGAGQTDRLVEDDREDLRRIVDVGEDAFERVEQRPRDGLTSELHGST
jgi:hypothetical protein